VKFQNSGSNVSAYCATCGVNITALLTPTNCTISAGQCTMSGAAATITLASIPAGYTSIRIVANVLSASVGLDTTYMQFNGDTSAHYLANFLFSAAAATPAGAGNTSLSAQAAFAAVTNSGSSSVSPGVFSQEIYNYAGTTFQKVMTGTFERWNAAANILNGTDALTWQSTAAITSLTVGLTSGSNLVAGSTFSVYAVP
jgi:hypothetical protein